MATHEPSDRNRLREIIRERRLTLMGMTVPEAVRRIGLDNFTELDWHNLERKGTGLGSAAVLIRLMQEGFLKEEEILDEN
jgi:hypothetical protein